MSLIDGRRRTATVTAASPMRVIAFSREDFLGAAAGAGLLHAHPHDGRRSTATGELTARGAGRSRFGTPQPRIRLGPLRRQRMTRRRRATCARKAGAAMATDEQRGLRWLAGSLDWEAHLATLRRRRDGRGGEGGRVHAGTGAGRRAASEGSRCGPPSGPCAGRRRSAGVDLTCSAVRRASVRGQGRTAEHGQWSDAAAGRYVAETRGRTVSGPRGRKGAVRDALDRAVTSRA